MMKVVMASVEMLGFTGSAQPTRAVLNDNEPCACHNAAFAKAMQAIQNAQIPYNPLSANSNATVSTTMQQGGFSPGTPSVWAPGWGTPMLPK